MDRFSPEASAPVEEGSAASRSWGRRISLERPINLLALAASVVAAISIVWAALAVLFDWVGDASRDELGEAAAQLERLQPGQPIARFENVLGGADLVSQAAGPDFLESTWLSDDHYVQTISNSFGLVVMYAVTTCNPELTPFGLGTEPLGAYGMEPWEWFLSGASANSFMFDVTHSSAATTYQTELRGWNDVCDGNEAEPIWACLPSGFDPLAFRVERGVPHPQLGVADRRGIEDCVVPNTYAVTAPHQSDLPVIGFCESDRCFGIGPDRVEVLAQGRDVADGW